MTGLTALPFTATAVAADQYGMRSFSAQASGASGSTVSVTRPSRGYSVSCVRVTAVSPTRTAMVDGPYQLRTSPSPSRISAQSLIIPNPRGPLAVQQIICSLPGRRCHWTCSTAEMRLPSMGVS